MNTYFFRYIVTGIIVTFYSLVVFYLLGSFSFLAVYFFVELSSTILKAYGYHYYVYNSRISSDLNHFLLIKKMFFRHSSCACSQYTFYLDVSSLSIPFHSKSCVYISFCRVLAIQESIPRAR